MSDSLQAETVRFTGHGGDEIEGYLAQPLDEGSFGGVVVIHHLPGYDEGMKEITRKFAAHGYLARTSTAARRRAPHLTTRQPLPGRSEGCPTSGSWATFRPRLAF